MIKLFENFNKSKFKVGDYVKFKKKYKNGAFNDFSGYWHVSKVSKDFGYFYTIENDNTVSVAWDYQLVKVPKYEVIANKYNL